MGPAVVLLHGFTQTAASWAPVIEQLPERYRALALDLRGHGAARDRRPIGFAECVADVAANAPERFTLGGYSLGARIALLVALAHPRRVERLVLVSGTAGIADEVEREARRTADLELAGDMDGLEIEDLARRWAAQPILRKQPEAVAEAAHRDRLRNDPRALAAALRGLGQGEMEPVWSRLPELAMPVTLVAGERDGRYRRIAKRMADAIPEARLVLVPEAGHAVHLEAPGLVAECLA